MFVLLKFEKGVLFWFKLIQVGILRYIRLPTGKNVCLCIFKALKDLNFVRFTVFDLKNSSFSTQMKYTCMFAEFEFFWPKSCKRFFL